MKFTFKQKTDCLKIIQFSIYFTVLVCSVFYGLNQNHSLEFRQNEKDSAVENALYTRTEFFGSQAIVPFPTAEARDRLAGVLQKYPGDSQIHLKLAELDEKLGRFDDAEQEIKAAKPENLFVLAKFYERRGEFEKAAETLEKILETSPIENRLDTFSNLIYMAKKHGLKKYLAAEFYQKFITENNGTFSVLAEFIEKLIEEKNYADASKFLIENRANFPDQKGYFLEKMISILVLQEKKTEALKVYKDAFDPFWSDFECQKFYAFLRDNDAYRAYRSELRQNFKKNPAEFQTAIRLVHFQKNNGDNFGEIIQKLENTRTARKIAWQTEELLTISQFLIEAGDGETASRFLYTICAGFKIENKSDLRRRVLYQLFELLSNSGYERLALTKGNLDFYETIAKSDALPGITNGILSLIFSDTNPRQEFNAKQDIAVRLFNRAAAYRIFLEFKTEYPAAPELASMYLDIIRLYTNSKDLDIASKTLFEFEQNFDGFTDFPDAALKISDAFIAVKQFEKEREIYQKLLDFLGKSEKPKFPVQLGQNENVIINLNRINPYLKPMPSTSSQVLNTPASPNNDEFFSKTVGKYENQLEVKTKDISYSMVLSRFVASHARENKTQEILNLYADEIAKYPEESRLYEQMLGWLGQTNLKEKEFEVYQKALQQFPQKSWQDGFARWLIRNKRFDDFENFSKSFVSTFDDSETQDYLKQFVDGKEFKDSNTLDSNLYFALYNLAHKRFPHHIGFVQGLLRFFQKNKMETEWRELLAEYYFESAEIRSEFLNELAKKGEIRFHLEKSEKDSRTNEIESLPYKLFQADASALLSEFEKSVVFYRELNKLYPNDPEFSENFMTISRSIGQTNRNLLLETATFSQTQAENFPANEIFQTRAGEIQAELGDYRNARQNWQKIIQNRTGEKESYLETATIFWDYFQFDDAIKTIQALRERSNNENLYAFQTGAILEAQQLKPAAITEYIKALDENENEADKNSARRRLKQLFAKTEFSYVIFTAFEKHRKTAGNEFRLVFNFADLLYQMNRQPDAVKLLLNQTATETSQENLLETLQFFAVLDEQKAIQITLRRLIQISENPHDSISYQLRLAENYRKNFETEKSSDVLADLVKKHPTNYGVLKESENFFWDLGKREKSLEVLESARKKSRGEFLYQFSRKLAQRLSSLNRINQAESILSGLQIENPNDSEVFSELTDIYVRTNQPEALRKAFSKTLEAIRKLDLEPREFIWQTETLRKKMISALTKLKDYDSAAEQYIEIINREPENQETVEEAIRFAKRYGGAAKLTEYYKKTAAEAFKNYRWNVILARIYEANNDLSNAAENYRTAIYNQPEMPELYESLGTIYIKMQNFEAALENLNKLLDVAGENKLYIKQKIQILEKLGKMAEAETEKQKLPVEILPKPQTLTEQFAEAQNLRNSETAKAIELYRQAFETLTQNPFQTEIKSADMTGFIQTVHGQDSLDSIWDKLWNLREKLIAEIETIDSVNSGKARENLKTIDFAMTETVGKELKIRSTGNEILAIRVKIEEGLNKNGAPQTVSLLQNLIVRCGFDDLQEKVLLKNLEISDIEETRRQNLRALVNYYQKRNDYQRINDVLEKESPKNDLEFLRIFSATARILENTEKELSALRQIFSLQTVDDEFTYRYLEILQETNRPELEALAKKTSAHQLQIINFLLSKKEFELASEAIRNSSFSQSWKLSRSAGISLNFGKFEQANEADFLNALQISTISELVKQKPEAQYQLIGSDWFNLSNQYGKWLFASNLTEKAEYFLPAKIENHPKAADEQFNLGFFYLEQKDYTRALEHFFLAGELKPNDISLLPYIGAAFFKSGESRKAFENWSKIIEGENKNFENAMLYLKTLSEFGQTEKARNDLKPLILAELKTFENNSTNNETSESLRNFIRNLSKSFADEDKKTPFFLEICKNSPNDKFLPQVLIEESLISPKDAGKFYEILIQRAAGFDDFEHDYGFVSILETTWDADEAEQLFDSEKDFEIEEPNSEKLDWQKKYLDYLLENRDFFASEKLIFEIENSLKGHYPRPVWLRLAKFRILLNLNKLAFAQSKFFSFVGIEVTPNTQKAAFPNLERLNQSVALLKSENQTELILNLQESFFARQLALGQINSANFIGLAKIEFQCGNPTNSLNFLKIMTDYSS